MVNERGQWLWLFRSPSDALWHSQTAPSHSIWPCTLWEARPDMSNTFSIRNMPSPTLGPRSAMTREELCSTQDFGQHFSPRCNRAFPCHHPCVQPPCLCGVSSLQQRMCNQDLQFRPRSRMLSLIYKAYTWSEPSIWFVLFVHILFSQYQHRLMHIISFVSVGFLNFKNSFQLLLHNTLPVSFFLLVNSNVCMWLCR